ncbi:MAG: hypothetical protein KGZ59_11110 [Chitinophagaceae bacterium]|nr:hypothetical protein [Chitinophagaceae bacterium]
MKTLFLVTPHFPPSSSPPSQRARLLVKHASSFGFYPICFTVQPKYREEVEDVWMKELLGTEYTEKTVHCLNQKTTRKFGIGDLGLRMLPFLFFKLINEVRISKPSFILYLVPPWYILVIAPIVKWLTKVPYGIDFIDPWVHDQEKKYATFKHKISQGIAVALEKWVCSNASIIFSVSEGINSNLIKRHPSLNSKPMFAIPYGAEQSDFDKIRFGDKTENKIILRYIGAIWNDCYPVLNGLMPSLKELEKILKIEVQFIGTSYAGEGLSKPQLGKWIEQNNMQHFVKENPLRVTYKKAVELTMSADILFLIGGMQPYYAASKLMGLVASQKPFVAFVHKDSFPALFLKEINYPYVVTYSSKNEELPINQTQKLTEMFETLIKNKNNFIPISLNNPLVLQHTANGMTSAFLQNISLVIK